MNSNLLCLTILYIMHQICFAHTIDLLVSRPYRQLLVTPAGNIEYESSPYRSLIDLITKDHVVCRARELTTSSGRTWRLDVPIYAKIANISTIASSAKVQRSTLYLLGQ